MLNTILWKVFGEVICFVTHSPQPASWWGLLASLLLSVQLVTGNYWLIFTWDMNFGSLLSICRLWTVHVNKHVLIRAATLNIHLKRSPLVFIFVSQLWRTITVSQWNDFLLFGFFWASGTFWPLYSALLAPNNLLTGEQADWFLVII